MDKNISKYLADNRKVLRKMVKDLNESFDYVSILASDCEGKRIRVSNKNVSAEDGPWVERGFVARVFKDGKYSEYSFDNLDNPKEIINNIIESAEIDSHLEKAIYVKASENILYQEEALKKDYSRMNMYEHMSFEDIVSRCKKIIDKSMDENEYIVSIRMMVEYLKVSKLFISTNKDLAQVYAWGCVSYFSIVNRDEKTKSNYAGESSVSLVEAFEKLEKNIKNVNEDANALLDSTNVEPGEYECITTPIITGLIAHEAFGHGVEMDMFVKNRALGQQYIGKRVGSDLVEMHEGAQPYLDVSSYFFDDEGTLAHDTVEIKDGILLTGVADAISASKLGISPTGNGKRENYQHKAYSRMTQTYFAPKEASLDEMIKSIKFGYLIDGEESGMEDPKNWGIQCIAIIGKEIKDGKLTGKVVSPIIMTGYVPDLLGSISMVSKDFALYGSGACGKGYKEWVKTSIGGPYLKAKVKLG